MKLGRNEPCHCGSGKKYKKCHMAEDNALSRPASPDPMSVQVFKRMAEKFMVSDRVDDDTLATVERSLTAKDAVRSSMQQLRDFAQPLLAKASGSTEAKDKALLLAMLFADIAQKPPEAREQAIEAALSSGADAETRLEFQDMAKHMIARHETMFPELHGK